MPNTELIDVLNDNGVPTGEIVSREEIHKRGLWHRACLCAIIDCENRILLQQRSLDKDKFPGLWDISVAAHVLHGESAMSTVVREMNEEVGAQIGRKVLAKDFRFLASFRNQMSISETYLENQFYDLFAYNMDCVADFKFNDNEVTAIEWATYSKILELQKAGKLHPRMEWVTPVLKLISEF